MKGRNNMKKLKKLLLLLIMFTMTMSLTGCGSKNVEGELTDVMEKVYIFGHRNPDTDSVCGAISLSYLKNKLGYNTIPRVLGDINDETKFALNYFDVPVPKYLNNVKVKIKDVFYHKDFYVRESDSIYKTYSFMNEKNITGVPLINYEKK
jgi:manganese-dependent inorganic pyrophosphatase